MSRISDLTVYLRGIIVDLKIEIYTFQDHYFIGNFVRYPNGAEFMNLWYDLIIFSNVLSKFD